MQKLKELMGGAYAIVCDMCGDSTKPDEEHEDLEDTQARGKKPPTEGGESSGDKDFKLSTARMSLAKLMQD